MVAKVFLLGRPGSGKTTAFKCIEEWAQAHHLPVSRHREYTILYTMFKNRRGEFKEAEHGGFDILDFSVLIESARCLQAQIQTYIREQARADELLFIELARDDYGQALRQGFTPDFLQDAYFLFVEADLETCIQRVHYRVRNPPGTDGHFISDHIVREHYFKDNRGYMTRRFRQEYDLQKKVVVIENNGSYDEFRQKLRPFADDLFSEIGIEIPVRSLFGKMCHRVGACVQALLLPVPSLFWARTSRRRR